VIGRKAARQAPHSGQAPPPRQTSQRGGKTRSARARRSGTGRLYRPGRDRTLPGPGQWAGGESRVAGFQANLRKGFPTLTCGAGMRWPGDLRPSTEGAWLDTT
jgi:hypothetical protein